MTRFLHLALAALVAALNAWLTLTLFTVFGFGTPGVVVALTCLVAAGATFIAFVVFAMRYD